MAYTGLYDGVKDTGNGAVMVPAGDQLANRGSASGVGIYDPRVSWIVRQVEREEPKLNKFREQARQAYRFDAGKQLSEEDERILKSQSRPTNCFNTAQKYIRYVSGIERDSHVALLFNAVSLENEQAQTYGERVAKLFEWAQRHTNGDAERSRAFQDFLITGMGWTATSISRAKDPKGLVDTRRISPLEMGWSEADRVNLEGTRCRWRESHVDKEELFGMFDTPEAHAIIDQTDDSAAPLTWPMGPDVIPYKIPYVQSFPLDKIGGGKGAGRKEKARLMQFEWWDNETGYIFEDPLDGTEQWMNEDQYREYQFSLKETFGLRIDNFDKQQGRKYQRAFLLARKALLEEPSDLPGNRFSYNCMCCHWDEWDKFWYGFMRVLIDPQRYLNKFFNQLLEIYSRQAKGGAFAEADAFEDEAQMRAFLDEYALPGSVNILASGGLGKIKEKGLPSTDAGTMAILKLCNDSMTSVTGLSDDSLGMGASTAAGTTVQRRQRAGMVLMAPEFDAESQFRREEGYITVDHLKLLSGDRLVRVGSGPDSQVIQLDPSPFSMEYDIELDELERDPSVRKYLADLLLGPFGQTLMRMNKFLPEFLQAFAGVYIPQTWVTKLKQMMIAQQKEIQQAQAQGLPVPGGRGPAKPLILLQAEVEGKKADAAFKIAKAGALAKKGGQDDLRLILSSLTDSLRLNQERERMTMDQGNANADRQMQQNQGGPGE